MAEKEKEPAALKASGKTPYELFKEIQQTIKVGKSKYNSFAKFNYRSVEDIYEEWKALGVPLTLTLTDEIISFESRLFVQATATVKDLKGVVVESSKAQAELGVGKAGMSSEQATGSASSYARKYALNGLFLLDDAKDPDAGDVKKPKVTGGPTVVSADDTARKTKILELQNLIRGNADKSAKATKLLAGRSILKLTVGEIDELINAVK